MKQDIIDDAKAAGFEDFIATDINADGVFLKLLTKFAELREARILKQQQELPTEVLEYIARLELKLESAKDLLNSFESCSRNNFDNLSCEEVDSINKTFASKPQSLKYYKKQEPLAQQPMKVSE